MDDPDDSGEASLRTRKEKPAPESRPPEKKVVFTDDLEVFTMSPDTTEVQMVSSSSKSKQKLKDPATVDLNTVIAESTEILDKYLKQCTRMISAAQVRTFMLHKIRESVQRYTDHLEKLKNFFFHHDRIQAKWYVEFCHRLPGYGDYLAVLKGPVREEVSPHDEVRKLVAAIVDNVYDAGCFVLSERALCKTIDHNGRRERFEDFVDPLSQHSATLQVIDDNCQTIKDTLTDLKAYVDFLKADQLDATVPDFILSNSLQ